MIRVDLLQHLVRKRLKGQVIQLTTTHGHALFYVFRQCHINVIILVEIIFNDVQIVEKWRPCTICRFSFFQSKCGAAWW